MQTVSGRFRDRYIRGRSKVLGAVAVIGMAFPGMAFASTATGGYVSNLSIAQDGSLWFAYTGTLSGSLPSCAEPNGLWIVTPISQAMKRWPRRSLPRRPGMR